MARMETPVMARTALLMVLLEGRGYGTELATRVKARTLGKVTVRQGSLYPALKQFQEEGLVKAFPEEGKEKKDNHTGRPRIYYQLTAKGKRAALEERAMLAQLIGAFSSEEAPEQVPVEATS